MDKDADWHVYDVFFEAIELFISKEISVIVEAAFQDKLWKSKLFSLVDRAHVKVILCKALPGIARDRFERRMQADPGRIRFHGDNLNQVKDDLTNFIPLSMDVPHLMVDTSNGYSPSLEQMTAFAQGN